MARHVDRSAVIRLFEDIRDTFPTLSMRLEHTPAQADLSLDIPAQPGLIFGIHLTLRGDELHVTAGAFWMEWFPCSRPDVVQTYREAVCGLLGGAYRIRERHRGGRAFKAELQRPDGTGWRTIATWSRLAWPFPRHTVVKVLQNVAGHRSGS